MLIWGREERTQLVVFLDALYPLLPPVPPEARSFALSYEGALEALVAKAGLTPREAGYLETTFEYPDEDTLLRGLLAAGPGVLAIRGSGEEAVRKALIEALAPFRRPDGRYSMKTEWRYVLAVA